ncbi:hypothetical protein C2E23DRAFT_825449 [Lenzites betulinus]|nr:hypothetical protein C2E23DRAFT_825449 [Lenzites betulinus]
MLASLAINSKLDAASRLVTLFLSHPRARLSGLSCAFCATCFICRARVEYIRHMKRVRSLSQLCTHTGLPKYERDSARGRSRLSGNRKRSLKTGAP